MRQAHEAPQVVDGPPIEKLLACQADQAFNGVRDDEEIGLGVLVSRGASSWAASDAESR